MKLVRDRGRRERGGTLPSFVALLLVEALFGSGTIVVHPQSTGRTSESPQMRQLHQALSLEKRGDGQGAMNLALRMLQENPKFVPAMKLKGMLLEEGGRTAEAAAVYEEALKLAPNDGDLLLKSGIYKLAAGEKEEALSLLLHCSRILPADGDVQYYLAQAYHLNGQDEMALRAIRQCLKAEPDNASVQQKYAELLCSTGNNQEGLRWLLKARRADAKLPRLDYEIGATDYKLMDINGAAHNLTRATEVDPLDMNALALLASAQIKLTHWEEAKQAYARLLTNNPDDVESLLGLGHCEVELKDYKAAVDSLDEVLRFDPRLLLAHFYLSRAYAGMGRTADAQHEAALHHLMMEQASFVRSTETEQREEGIKTQARQFLTQHRDEDALRLYQEHFKGTSATKADSFVFVGKLYLFMGDTEDGLRFLRHALEMEPTVRGAHTYEGILALKLGSLSQAENEFQAELANDPNYQMAIAEMGEVRYHQERWSEAADLLAKSRTTTPELLYMFCDANFHLGKIQEADLDAETAAAYGRNNLNFMQGLIELLKRNGQTELAGHLASDLKP